MEVVAFGIKNPAEVFYNLIIYPSCMLCSLVILKPADAVIMMNVAAYCVVAVESAGRQIPIAFLERIKEDFTKRYGGDKAATAVANSLNKEFGYLPLFVTL